MVFSAWQFRYFPRECPFYLNIDSMNLLDELGWSSMSPAHKAEYLILSQAPVSVRSVGTRHLLSLYCRKGRPKCITSAP